MGHGLSTDQRRAGPERPGRNHNGRVSKQRRPFGKPGAASDGQPSYGLGPLDAIAYGFRRYGAFHGRASRSEFWWWVLCNGVVLAVCGLFMLFTIVPNISITIRRLHDTGNSGNIYLLNLIPYVGAIVVLIVCTVRSSSTGVRFDRPRPGQTSVLPPRGSFRPTPAGAVRPTQPFAPQSYDQPPYSPPTDQQLDDGWWPHSS